MKKKEVFDILVRYTIALIFGVFMWVFYEIFSPITSGLAYFMLKIIYPGAVLDGELVILGEYSIKLIPACIAGAAYYLLFLLNMSTPMAYLTRIKSLIFLWLAFLVMNVARIAIFAVLFVNDYAYVSLTHVLFWYLGSTILVIAIWFVNILFFKIKKVPFVSDVKNIFEETRTKHRLRKTKSFKPFKHR